MFRLLFRLFHLFRLFRHVLGRPLQPQFQNTSTTGCREATSHYFYRRKNSRRAMFTARRKRSHCVLRMSPPKALGVPIVRQLLPTPKLVCYISNNTYSARFSRFLSNFVGLASLHSLTH